MKELYKELASYFPSKFHSYNLSYNEGGIYFQSLHWSFYLVLFIIIFLIVYNFICWESIKYKNFFLAIPKSIKEHGTNYNYLLLFACIMFSLLLASIPYIMTATEDITNGGIDLKKQQIYHYRNFYRKEFSFNKTNKICSEVKELAHRHKNGRVYYTTAVCLSVDYNFPIFYYIHRNFAIDKNLLEEAKDEAAMVAEKMNKIIKACKINDLETNQE